MVAWGEREAGEDRPCGGEPGRGRRRVIAVPAAAGLAGGGEWLLGPGAGGWAGQARTHDPSRWLRPRRMRLRRLRAAVRFLSQALFLAVPR